ncbi:LysR substrate-binding domain-containing protein [Stenoxybacter acetivorans]|uniref:LysR substrate-binding domain-containing protein n=1 Tax=Stenoxybacter acetivorans TaxID=422441 RepID=UPI00055C8BAD|nr:LysR substrate-binding domain-containing protein [Stenoxybacter acetivorans]
MTIKIAYLKTFHAIVECGSIRSASKLLNVAQPVLTRNIQNLEASLGVQLFSRAASGMSLTAQGRKFSRHISIILKELSLAEEEIKQEIEKYKGHISIGIGSSFYQSIVSKALSRFLKDYPQSTVSLYEGQSSAMLNQLKEGYLDFCISTINPAKHKLEFNFEKLMSLQYSIFARKNHPALTAQSMDELKEQQWIFPMSQIGWHQEFYEKMLHSGITLKVSCYTGSLGHAADLVSTTDCLSCFFSDITQFLHYGDKIQALQNLPPIPSVPYYLVSMKNTPFLPLTKILIRYIQQEIGVRRNLENAHS